MKKTLIEVCRKFCLNTNFLSVRTTNNKIMPQPFVRLGRLLETTIIELWFIVFFFFYVHNMYTVESGTMAGAFGTRATDQTSSGMVTLWTCLCVNKPSCKKQQGCVSNQLPAIVDRDTQITICGVWMEMWEWGLLKGTLPGWDYQTQYLSLFFPPHL